MMKNYLWIFLFILNLFIGCDNFQKVETVSSGNYLGQTPPLNQPKLFAPGIVSTGMYERDITMTPDANEIYFSRILGNFEFSKIMVIKRINGVWTDPEVASFSMNSNNKDLEPCISPDGSKFYFVSDRPDSAGKRYDKNNDIWVMNRIGSDWSKPFNLGSPINSDLPEFFPSLTNNGTIYFTRDLDGGSYIYKSVFINGKFTEPKKLNNKINSTNNQFNAFIAPDESYIIVPTYGRKESLGATDYFICFNLGHEVWTDPIHMGSLINSKSRDEYSSFVSRDGRYLFFMSSDFNKSNVNFKEDYNLKGLHNMPENGSPDIYWISADFIKTLKPD
jgi:hypothetical protein